MQKDCQLQYTFIAPAEFVNLSNGKDETLIRAGIFIQSMGSRNRVGIGLMYRPARLHRLAEFIAWNRFLGSINV
jgi:hypothetical protein